jgi:hypothetical protein
MATPITDFWTLDLDQFFNDLAVGTATSYPTEYFNLPLLANPSPVITETFSFGNNDLAFSVNLDGTHTLRAQILYSTGICPDSTVFIRGLPLAASLDGYGDNGGYRLHVLRDDNFDINIEPSTFGPLWHTMKASGAVEGELSYLQSCPEISESNDNTEPFTTLYWYGYPLVLNSNYEMIFEDCGKTSADVLEYIPFMWGSLNACAARVAGEPGEPDMLLLVVPRISHVSGFGP